MWVEGNANYKLNPLTKDQVHFVASKLGKFSFKKKDIPNYVNEYFLQWLKLWKWWKKGVMPYNKGWLDHPWKIVKVLETFDVIYDEKVNKHGT